MKHTLKTKYFKEFEIVDNKGKKELRQKSYIMDECSCLITCSTRSQTSRTKWKTLGYFKDLNSAKKAKLKVHLYSAWSVK